LENRGDLRAGGILVAAEAGKRVGFFAGGREGRAAEEDEGKGTGRGVLRREKEGAIVVGGDGPVGLDGEGGIQAELRLALRARFRAKPSVRAAAGLAPLPFLFRLGIGQRSTDARASSEGHDNPKERLQEAAARGSSDELTCQSIEAIGVHGVFPSFESGLSMARTCLDFWPGAV